MKSDKMPSNGVESWNALMLGPLICGEEVLDCFEQMQLRHAWPNGITYASELKACGNSGELDLEKVLHVEVF